MRILFLANDGEGLYKFRKELIQELIKNNEVFISLPRDKYIEKLEGFGCRFIETSFNRKGTNPINDIKQLKFYINLLKEIKPNVVLTYTIKPNVYGGIACQIENIPYLVNITGGVGSIDQKGLVQKVAIFLYRIALRKAHKVFFQNTANKQYMLSKHMVSIDKCELIPGSGVNLGEYKLLEFPDDNTIDFTYIGRIMAEKGFNQYIEAAQVIRNKYPNTRFHICGEYEDDYKQIVDDLVNKDIVIYHGNVSNMIDIYKIVQCTIHPTYYPEGLSNVLLESCASGRVIITTNRPGCKEVIEDGFNGFVVKEKDSNDLIEKIEKYLSLTNKERKQLGLNARKKVEKEFDRNIVINKYINIINNIK